MLWRKFVRADIRNHLQNSGVLDLPRLIKTGADLVDISAGRASYEPSELPKIHVIIQQETSAEDTSDLSSQIRTALMTLTVYVGSYDSSWRPYSSYYDESIARTRPYTLYDDSSKNDLRSDLEEIAQEISYRLRRDDLTQIEKVLSIYDQAAEYNITSEAGVTTGIAVLTFEVRYRT